MSSTRPKPFVFVLMPFSEGFEDTYNLGIKAACVEAGAYCERVDEQFFDGSILERIYNQIGKADVIVADLTGRNPNVFYETGYAHALGKRVVLLTQQTDDIPFDFKHYAHIVYGGKIGSLKNDLEKRIRWAIDNPTEALESVEPQIELFVQRVRVEENAKLPLATEGTLGFKFGDDLRIDIHNVSDQVVDLTRLRFALKTAEYHTLGTDRADNEIKLPDGSLLIYASSDVRIFPDDWASVTYTLFLNKDSDREMAGRAKRVPYTSEATIRMISALGPRDIPVRLDGAAYPD